MTENSKIEWTHHTFNPWIGCTKVSPGCENCYAEGVAERFKMATWGTGQPRKLTSDANWKQPLSWNKRAGELGVRERVFCASLADIFDNEVNPAWRTRLWALVEATPNLDWLILTKRIGNANKMVPWEWPCAWKNVWVGASIVNQEEADRDIKKLIAVPAVVRFLSMEPLLAPVNILHTLRRLDVDVEKNAGINWVIVGGESGPNARPMQAEWVRDLRDQCRRAGIAFFFKQWGEWAPYDRGGVDSTMLFRHGCTDTPIQRIGKKLAGRLLDGKTWDDYPR